MGFPCWLPRGVAIQPGEPWMVCKSKQVESVAIHPERTRLYGLLLGVRVYSLLAIRITLLGKVARWVAQWVVAYCVRDP